MRCVCACRVYIPKPLMFVGVYVCLHKLQTTLKVNLSSHKHFAQHYCVIVQELAALEYGFSAVTYKVTSI